MPDLKPVRYRWDAYGGRKAPGPWFSARTGHLLRAMRALRMPQERIRVEFDNGQHVIFRPRSARG